MHEVDELLTLSFGHISRRIEPYQTDRPIIREYLAHLRLDLFLEVFSEILFAFILKIPIVADSVRLVPILRLRIIETELDAGLLRGGGKFF